MIKLYKTSSCSIAVRNKTRFYLAEAVHTIIYIVYIYISYIPYSYIAIFGIKFMFPCNFVGVPYSWIESTIMLFSPFRQLFPLMLLLCELPMLVLSMVKVMGVWGVMTLVILID